MLSQKRFGEELKRAVTDAGLGPADIAREAEAAGEPGVHRTTIYRWYNGDLPRLQTLSAVLDRCELTLTEFFARVEGVALETAPPNTPSLASLKAEIDQIRVEIPRAIADALASTRAGESGGGQTPAGGTKGGSGQRRSSGPHKTGT